MNIEKMNIKVIKNPLCVLLAAALLLSLIFSLTSCGLDLVEKTELGLSFAIPEDFERAYDYGANIEYKGEETAFLVDLIPYSAYELSYGASVKTCTEAIIDKLQLGGVNINYNQEAKTAQFDTWTSDQEGSESYYSYIVVLLAKEGIFVARYVCAGTEKEIEKHTDDFVEMAKYLKVVNP